jgi:hypothetical protein
MSSIKEAINITTKSKPMKTHSERRYWQETTTDDLKETGQLT